MDCLSDLFRLLTAYPPCLVLFSKKFESPHYGDPFLLAECSRVLVIGNTFEIMSFGGKEAKPVLKRRRPGPAGGCKRVFYLRLDDNQPELDKLMLPWSDG